MYNKGQQVHKKGSIMKRVLVTGSKGFVGRNLCVVLRQSEDVELYEYDVNHRPENLDSVLCKIDYIIHLAGVNRPENPDEFEIGNARSIDEICVKLKVIKRSPKIVLSSSIQAELDNPYGVSKRRAEKTLQRFAEDTGSECVVYRFKNLFGKWCLPNYNSVTATFCHNIANDLPVQISDPTYEIDLTHIDDVVNALIYEIQPVAPGFRIAEPLFSTPIKLGELASKIRSFRDMRTRLLLPDFSNNFVRALYGTYLTYLDEEDFEYGLSKRSDQRGSLAEFIKSPAIGQIFVSRTNPGITRGEHYHLNKTEKFLVLEGDAVVRLRNISANEIIKYTVSGENYQVIDIPPGYTHSIENVGTGILVTLFWSNEMFNLDKPDTYFEKV